MCFMMEVVDRGGTGTACCYMQCRILCGLKAVNNQYGCLLCSVPRRGVHIGECV